MREKLLSPDPLAGSGYRSLAVLGEGSMGIVVEAEHLALRKTVCVKLLRREMTDDPSIVERFRIEAQALAALGGGNHPNLVHVSDFGVTANGARFLVMERLRGRTLKEEIEARGAMPWREATELTLQLLAGLDVAHDRGVVHRDIKPANLFLVEPALRSSRSVLKILDFGIAKILKGGDGVLLAGSSFETEPGLSIGTPRYLSPEQAFAKPVDHRADLYAAGLVLYELLAARGPFQHRRSVQDIYRAQALEIPEPPSKWVADGIAPELDALILKLLEKAPEDRFASAKQATEALQQLLDAPPHDTAPIVATVGSAPPKVIQTELMQIEPRLAAPRRIAPETVRLEVAPKEGSSSVVEMPEMRGHEGDADDSRHVYKGSVEQGSDLAPAPPIALVLGRPVQHWIAFAVVVISSVLLFSLAAWLLLRRSP